MVTKSLYKLFYADSEMFKREYESRFNDKNTLHLDIKIGEHSAFVCQSAEIFRLIISIERTDKKIAQLAAMLPAIALEQFTKRCLIDEIVLTNNIEGVHSTRKEISEILQDLYKKNKRERFVGLVRKYELLSRNEKLSIASCEDIRKLYDDIFFEEIKANDPDNLPDGKIFRKAGVGVFSELGQEIHHGIEPESKIISYMEQALKMLGDDSIDLLLRTAVFHYLFGYIHPFYDGNGRTSRFISSYLLSQALNRLISYRISFTIKENIKKYYESFKICNHHNNKGDLTPFAEMFLGIVDILVRQLLDALTERSDKLKYYESLISAMPNGIDDDMQMLYRLLIQAALFSEKGITMSELKDALGKSYNTVKLRLKKIPDDMLSISNQGRQLYYMLKLEAVDNGQY